LRLFLFGVLHGQALSLSRRLTPELCHARDRAPAKYDHLKRETGPDKRKSGVGPVFQSSVSGFVARMERSAIRERNIRPLGRPGLRCAPSGLRIK
jgi:hypothetical protein